MRTAPRYSSHALAATGSGQKNGFSSTACQSHRARSIRCGPICTRAPRTRTAFPSTSRATAPAATRQRGLARRGAAAAARVAHAVFQVVREIGMARTELLGDVAVVARALVHIVDLQGDRRAGGQPFIGAGQDAHGIRLGPLRGEARLAGAAAVEPGLDVGLRQTQSGRAAVDHAADGGAVALAPGRDPEQMTEAVMRHR